MFGRHHQRETREAYEQQQAASIEVIEAVRESRKAKASERAGLDSIDIALRRVVQRVNERDRDR
jgi:phage gp37-like protein